MGIFDGILICSDFDGTLFYNGEISSSDINSIKYFQENGGLFTVCSGRGLSFIKGHEDKVCPNTYSIVQNGSLIVDASSGEKLFECFIDAEAEIRALDILIHSDCFDYLMVYYPSGPKRIEICEYDIERQGILCNLHYGSMIVAKEEHMLPCSLALLANTELSSLCLVKSWRLGLDIIPHDGGKGQAVKRVTDKVGARISVAVGDYDNDSDMLLSADISYAVGNASPKALTCAKRKTVCVWENAITHIIEELKNEAK